MITEIEKEQLRKKMSSSSHKRKWPNFWAFQPGLTKTLSMESTYALPLFSFGFCPAAVSTQRNCLRN